MDFFDKLGKKAQEAYQTTKDKTKEISGELKIKSKINQNEDRMYELFAHIGEIVCNAHEKNVEVDKDEIDPMCDEVKKLKEENEKYRLEYLELNNKKLCVKCGAELSREDGFCQKCGAKQPPVETKGFRVESSAPEDAKEVENENEKK